MSTIEKRNGAYRITVSCGVDVTGKQIRRRMTWKPDSGMTAKQIEKELQRQKVLFEEQCAKGLAVGGNIKLADFIELFFKNYAAPMLKKKTITSYRGFTPVVNQALGHLRIDKIKPHHLNEFYHQLSTIGSKREDVFRPLCDLRQLLNEKKLKIAPTARACGVKENTLRNALDNKPVYKPTAQALCAYLQLDLHKTFQREQRSKPLSAETIRHYNAFLSTVFSTAIKWEMLDANPCSRATLPHKEKRNRAILTRNRRRSCLNCSSKRICSTRL